MYCDYIPILSDSSVNIKISQPDMRCGSVPWTVTGQHYSTSVSVVMQCSLVN